MKPMEIKAAKDALRDEIKQAAEQIKSEIIKPGRIPQEIVNGSLSAVVQFKNAFEEIAADQVLHKPPPNHFH